MYTNRRRWAEKEGSAVETMTIVRGNSGAKACSDARVDVRRSDRPRMIETGQFAFGGSVLDCALLDVSRGGARLHLSAPAAMPEITALRLLRRDARGRAALAVSALHWTALAVSVLASVAAGVTLWLGQG